MGMRHTVALPFIHEWHPGTWAKDHCLSYLSATAYWNVEDPDTSIVEYHFEDEKDVAIFTLRWI